VGRGAAAVPGALGLPGGDLPHVLLQPAGATTAGRPVGLLCVVSEDTERVHRPATDGDPAGPGFRSERGCAPSPEMLAFVRTQLGAQPAATLPFTLLYRDRRRRHGAGLAAAQRDLAPGIRPRRPSIRPGDPHARVGRPTPPPPAPSRSWSDLAGDRFRRGCRPATGEQPPTQALLVSLLRRGGNPYGFPGRRAQTATGRSTPAYRRFFVELTAAHVAAGIASAPALPVAAAPGRGAGRTRPGQDRVLLQHQPRVSARPLNL